MWDQAKNPGTSPEKKARPLFSAGEGRKRENGISVWNTEGLEFYYMVECRTPDPVMEGMRG